MLTYNGKFCNQDEINAKIHIAFYKYSHKSEFFTKQFVV